MWLGIGKRKRKRAEDGFTFLGKGARFKGSITFEGTVRIDGRLEGEIHTKGTVIIGEHAVIEGDVIADSVISGGRISGNVVGTDKVQLITPGVLVGTVKTALFSLEEGVRFSGKCEAEGRGELRTLDQSRPTAVQSTTPRIRGVS
jgi:cytoskeletal protein CcmA (bactofilin family)